MGPFLKEEVFLEYTYPQVSDFQNYFVRDFPYGTNITTSVTNTDIQNSLNDATGFINQSLYGSQAEFNTAYLNLAAHFMVMSLRASSQGISGKFDWLNGSKGVGSVSESFQIPPRILANPNFAVLAETNYGLKFLFLSLPAMIGQMYTVHGRTHA